MAVRETHQYDCSHAHHCPNGYEVACPVPAGDGLEQHAEGGASIDEEVGLGQCDSYAHKHVQHSARDHGSHDGQGHISLGVLGLCTDL